MIYLRLQIINLIILALRQLAKENIAPGAPKAYDRRIRKFNFYIYTNKMNPRISPRHRGAGVTVYESLAYTGGTKN